MEDNVLRNTTQDSYHKAYCSHGYMQSQTGPVCPYLPLPLAFWDFITLLDIPGMLLV